jgi:predicted amidohydrolase YtcJ
MDMILFNADVITMGVPNKRQRAVAVKDGRIAFVGGDHSALALATESTRCIDLHGATVLPGLIDSHMHGFATGLTFVSARLETATDVAAVCERMAEQASKVPKGAWVYGMGGVPWALKEGRYPTMAEMDAAVPDNPVYMSSATFHSGATNTRGFGLIGIDPGRHGVEKDAAGRPTGSFVSDDTHFEAASVAFSALTDDEIADLFRQTAAFAASRGATTLHCLDGQFIAGDRDVKVLLDVAPDLPVHTVLMYQTMDVQRVLELGLPRIGGCLTIDGAGFEHTALMYEPYADVPSTCGDLYISEEKIRSFVREAHAAGLQIGMHAIGDRAVDILTAAYEEVLAELPRDDCRHRAEHFYCPTPVAIERAERDGLALTMQPVFSWLWDYPGGPYERFWGPERAAKSEPFPELCRRGMVISGGSDSPVTEIAPLVGIHGAVNNPRECRRVSVEDALRMFTINGAWVALEEKEKGTLEVGKLADIVVLDRDPYREPDHIKDFAVEMTITEGRVVYERVPA